MSTSPIASTRSAQVDLLDYHFKTTHPRTAPMYFAIETTSEDRAIRLAAQRHHLCFEGGSCRNRVEAEDIQVHFLGTSAVDTPSVAVLQARGFWDERQGYVSLDMGSKSATIITDSGDNSTVFSNVCRTTVMDELARHDWFPVQGGTWELHFRPQGGANYFRHRVERGDS